LREIRSSILGLGLAVDRGAATITMMSIATLVLATNSTGVPHAGKNGAP
jgi:hypothetical protein